MNAATPPTEPSWSIDTPGDRVRAARLNAGYATVEQACAAKGFRPKAMTDHEAGRVAFIGRSAWPYGEAFDVSPQWLMFGTPGEAPHWANPERVAFKRWMKSRGLNVSRVETAIAIRFAGTSMYRWLKGDTDNLKLEIRQAIARTYQTSIDAIFGGSNRP